MRALEFSAEVELEEVVISLMLWYMPMRRSRRQLVWQFGSSRSVSERRPMIRWPVLFQEGYRSVVVSWLSLLLMVVVGGLEFRMARFM